MSNNLIDSLVNIQISISNGTANVSAFNNILLLDLERANAKGVTGLDSFTSLSDIVYAGWDEDTEIYKAANIAIKNGATVLYIYTAKDGESITDALEKASKNSGWYGFMLIEKPTEIENGDETVTEHTLPTTDELKEAAAWGELNNKLFGFVIDMSDGITEDLMPLDAEKDGCDYFYSVAYATNLVENPDNVFMAVAAFAKNMTFQAGAEVWAYKTLSGIVADELGSDDVELLQRFGFNAYAPCAGKDITLNGKVVGGEWTDVIRFRDWLLDDMQTRVYSVFTDNAKVPFSTAGITLIENQMLNSLKTGQEVGGIAETEYDADGNAMPGYTTTMPTISNVTDADRWARVLKGCSFTARLSGAIHLVEIIGVLST